MDKKQRKANQKLQQAQNFAENLRANQKKLRQIILSSHLLERWYPFSLILLTI